MRINKQYVYSKPVYIKRIIRPVIVFLFIINTDPAVFAQRINIEQYKEKYSSEDRVYLDRKKSVEISFNEDKLNIFAYTSEKLMHLNRNAVIKSKENIMFNNFSKIIDISAQTKVPLKNNKFKTCKVEEFNIKDVLDNGIFHSDIKTISFIYPNLSEGAITEVSYTNRISDPRFLSGFVFNTYVIAENAEFSITFPDNVEIGYTLLNDENNDIKFTETESGKNTTYTSSAKNISKIPYEQSSLNYKYYSAHLIVYIKHYTVNNTKIRVLSDLDDLHSWYYNLVENINTGSNGSLQYFVDSLVRDEVNDLDKIRKIFYWVQDNIRYIALEEGLGGFIPRDAEKVFLNRYGDCKDMSNIITKMLDLAGIESYLTWIGTRDIPYSYSEVFTPVVDNHMIASYISDDSVIFLDATGGYLPVGLPSSFIQGKEALISLGEEKYRIYKVEEIEAERNKFIDTVKMKLNNMMLTGKGKAYYTGYQDVFINNLLREKTNDEQLEIVKNYFIKGNNKYRINNINVKNLNNREKNTIIDYDFELEDYATIIDDQVFVNMHLDKSIQYNKIDDGRKLDFEQEYKNITVYYTSLEIPDGYIVDYLPEDIAFENQNFSFSIHYEIKENKIILDHVIKIDHLILKTEMFHDWNEMIMNIQNAYGEVVLLKKNK